MSPRTVRRLAKAGALPRVKVGRSTRYRESDVQAFIRDLDCPPRQAVA
jgi:excisionase family DNA binding protein